METTEVDQNRPRAVFATHGVAWLYDHAQIITCLTGETRTAQVEELAQRLRNRGISADDSYRWALWAVALVEHATAEELLWRLLT